MTSGVLVNYEFGLVGHDLHNEQMPLRDAYKVGTSTKSSSRFKEGHPLGWSNVPSFQVGQH